MNKKFTKKVKPLLLQIRNISALFFALFSSNIVYAQAPLYFDLEGLFQGIILWIATIIASFSFKRKSISVPIAILWPFVFSIVGYQIEKLQHVWAGIQYKRDLDRAYNKAIELCKTPSTIQVNRMVTLSAPTWIHIPDDSKNITESDLCWNHSSTAECSNKETYILPCWITGHGCTNNTIAGLEFDPYTKQNTDIPVVYLPELTSGWTTKKRMAPIAKFELRVGVEKLLPNYLSRDEVSLVELSTNQVLSKTSFVHYSGRDGWSPKGEPAFDRPSYFCPNRDETVANLFSKTFKIVDNNHDSRAK